MSDINQIRCDIKELKLTLKKKKKELFLCNLLNILGCSESELKENISDIGLNAVSSSEWTITYKHKTDCYNENDYVNSSDSEIEECNPYSQTVGVSFGISDDKYFIKRLTRLPARDIFTVYRGSDGLLRIINAEYELDIDMVEQKKLIRKYLKNKNIPEWLALTLFTYMNANDITEEKLFELLTC